MRAARLAAGIETARELAAEIGVQENTLTSWERGTRYPDPEAFEAWTRATGATLDFVFLGDLGGMPYRLAKRLAQDPSIRTR